MKNLTASLIACLVWGLAAPVLADPPDHAPAHGWRDQHERHDRGHDRDRDRDRYERHDRDAHPRHRGYSGAVYVDDYGITQGRCNRDAIGTALGAATGAVIGGQVTNRDDRGAGIVIGAITGAVLGHAIGDAMDDRDRACMGHALELGRPGVPVNWQHGRESWRFTPGKNAANGCRYATVRVDGGTCPRGAGVPEWARPVDLPAPLSHALARSTRAGPASPPARIAALPCCPPACPLSRMTPCCAHYCVSRRTTPRYG